MRYLALHGFTGDGADFSALSHFVGGEWRCPNLPGHGKQSSAPPERFAIESLANTLVDAVYGTSTKNLCGIGYSMGGRLLLHLALSRPEAFSKIVLIGASPGLKTQLERQERILSDRQWIRILESKGISQFLDKWWSQPVLAGFRNLPSDQRREIQKRRSLQNPDGLIQSLRLHGTGALPSLWDRLCEIKIPILLIVGQEDLKFRKTAEEMKSLNPGITLCSISNCGHMPHLENPSEIDRAINCQS